MRIDIRIWHEGRGWNWAAMSAPTKGTGPFADFDACAKDARAAARKNGNLVKVYRTN